MTLPMHYIMTLKELKSEIKKADVVYGTLRFGATATSLKISKKEALAFVDELVASTSSNDDRFTDGSDATPEDFEMYGGCFGAKETDSVTGEKVVYLG